MSEAESGPFLDLGKNNSTSPEIGPNDRYDCRRVYSNLQFVDDEGNSANFRCNSWRCYCCGYRMRMNLVEEIQRICRSHPELSRLLTLTLDPSTAPRDQERQHRYLTERWNALRTAINREHGDTSYIWIREEQDSGLPHLHILVSRYLPQQWVSSRWSELGGGEIVDIRSIDRLDKAAHYIGKYLTKDALSGLPDGIRRYGSSQNLDLEVRGSSSGSESSWKLLIDDYEITGPDGSPLTRGVARSDFSRQLEWGGPRPPPPPSKM